MIARIACRVLPLAAVAVASLGAQAGTKDLTRKVDAYLAPLAAMDVFRGSVLIAKGDKVLFEGSYGEARAGSPNAADTRFKLLSISKPLTTVLLMRYVQDGRISLEDPVGKHLPAWPAAWQKVTVHDLLDHRSGLPPLEQEWVALQKQHGLGRRAWPHLAAAAAQRPLLAPAGATFSYENYNLMVAGLVLEYVGDADCEELLRTQLYEPLHLHETRADDGAPHDDLATGHRLEYDGTAAPVDADLSFVVPSMGICSTIHDLYRLDRALAAGEFLSPATQARMFAARHEGHACSWVLQTIVGRPCQRHSGSGRGFHSDVLRFPDDDAVILVLGNLEYAPLVRVSEDLAALLFGKKVELPRRLDQAALRRICGGFAEEKGRYVQLYTCGDKLLVMHAGDAEVARGTVVIPLGRDRFAEARSGAELELQARGQRLKSTAVGEVTTLQRDGKAAARWRETVGAWRTVAGFVPGAQVLAKDGALQMQFTGLASLPLLPVTADRALLLHEPMLGLSLVHSGDQLRCRIQGSDIVLARDGK